MSSEWLQNMCGMTLDEDKMQMIPHPTTELVIHVTTKTTQLFGTLGAFLVGPVVAARQGDIRNWPVVRHHMLRAGRRGLLLGLVAGPLSSSLISMYIGKDSTYDLCYRIRHNRGQVRVDRMFMLCTAGGTGLALATKASPLFGGLIGMSSGIFLASFYNNVLAKP